MAQNMPRALAPSSGSGQLSRGSLDVSLSNDDVSSVGDDGGALDALWRLEEAHHLLLNQHLAVTHATFVDDLYAALETTRDALERQSMRILTVLHDKDARIRELESAGFTAASKVDGSVQVGPRQRHQSTQSELLRDDDAETLRYKVHEQEEQIDVLLDELERTQRIMSEKEKAEDRVCSTEAKATQTKSVAANIEPTMPSSDQALVALAALQQQLDIVEQSNAELRITLEQSHAGRDHEPATVDEEVDAFEQQFHAALGRMATASQCRVSLWRPLDESAVPCLDLDHQMHVACLERDALMDEILALRAALATGVVTSSTQVQALQETGNNVHSTKCAHVTCHHALRSVLRHVQAQRECSSGRNAKILRSELRHAMRGRKKEEVVAMLARVVAEWMGWEAAHVEEMASLRRAHARQLELQAARVTNLVDEIHRLNQRTIDLQTELNVSTRQRNEESAAGEVSTLPLVFDPVASDRHILELEQSLLVKQEQLDVANRAILAMSLDTRSVRFAGQDNIDQTSCSSHGVHDIAQLSMELQALQARHYRRFQPADTSQHAVVEYFRLEKQCLGLKHRLKEKDDRIQQLELLCEQLEQTARRVYTKNESQSTLAAIEEVLIRERGDKTALERQGTIERYYLRVLEKRNQDLWLEMKTARARIFHLERVGELQDGADNDDSRVVRELVARMEEYNMRAVEAFRTWTQNVGQANDKQREVATPAQFTLLTAAYGALLGHYETLSLQLRLFQTAQTSQSTSRSIDASGSVSQHWHLLERIHVLEDRLLQAQSCLSCGQQVVKQPQVKRTNIGIVTEVLALADSATQVSVRDRMRQTKSRSVQVSPEMVPFHTEQSQPRYSDRLVAAQRTPTKTALGTIMVDGHVSSHTRLGEIQQQLETSLARIDELTAQKEKLKERLEDAKRANWHYGKEQETLRAKLAEMSSSNASLSSQLRQYRETQQSTDSNKTIPSTALGTANQANTTLAVTEQEKLELIRQLCEAKEKCYQAERSLGDAEQRARKLEETVKALKATRVEDENRHLEDYVVKVNKSLMVIERDKERLTHENQELQKKLKQVERAVAVKEAQGTRTCGTETDVALEIDRLVQLPEYQAIETRAVMLQNELEMERRAHEELRTARDAEQREKTRREETERSTIDLEKAALRKLADEIRTSHELLQREFEVLQCTSADARDEAERRIHFLTACVEECSRLVDTAGPHDESVTSRDIHDTIVTLSKRVSAASANPSTPRTPQRLKPRENKSTPVTSNEPTPVLGASEAAEGIQLHSQLQAETWRIRVAKLESSLRAVSLKNKTFEDMVDHLEVQMDGLRDEVKQRMTNESTLLTKQGHLKVENTSLKAQNGTLTSRLAEACGELKRSQDVLKGTDGEIARLRSALQRKTELLTRQKTKCDETQKALDHAMKRIAHLEAAEKNGAIAQLKLRDQTLQMQELRQQWSVSRDANVELRAQADKLKEQLSELQSRGKALRLDNGMLRDQLRELKKTIRAEAEMTLKSHASDTVTAAAVVLGDGKTPSNLTPTAAVDMLASQVKTLKRRVLQKQEVILAYKTKLSQVDAELTLQRTKLFDVSQTFRQFQQTQQEKEQRMMQGATQLKDDLEHSLVTTAEQLDGLRASIFDACEVFVQRDPPHAISAESSSASLTWPTDMDEELLQPTRGDTETSETLLQEVRRYAHLSPTDLADLHLTSPKRSRQSKQSRLDREYAAHAALQHGARVLRDLEHALEVAPHDCRSEICSVLEFLCVHRQQVAARRY